MRKIGLDLGKKTCGIAISDKSNLIASGLYNFEYSNNDLMQVINKLKTIFINYDNQIDTFVLGYPTFNLSGQKTENTKLIEKFEELLKRNFEGIEVIKWNENYTTKQANEYLYNFDIKSSKRKKIIDMVSACIILQGYLDKQK